jgi:hypothetical protein
VLPAADVELGNGFGFYGEASEIRAGITSIRIAIAVGSLGAVAGVVLLVFAPDVRYLIAAIGLGVAGPLLLALGADRYERLKPAERRPIVDPRVYATVLIFLGTGSAVVGILLGWDLAVSDSGGEPRAWRLPASLLVAALVLFVTAWSQLRRASRAVWRQARGDSSEVVSGRGEHRAARTFTARRSPKREVILPAIPPEPVEQWARPDHGPGGAEFDER